MTVFDFIRAALPWDTLIADAMLKACGVTREQAKGIVKAHPALYEDMEACFANKSRVRLDYGVRG